jgi:hypothetical protein
MTLFQRIRWSGRYILDHAKWLWRTQPLIAFLAAVVVVFFWSTLLACLERQIRLSGMSLQLLGVALVAIGLRDTRRAFEDQPTTWEGIKRWWSRRPKFGPRHHVVAVGAGSIGLSGGSARARVSSGPATPIDQRVALLEEQYAKLFDEVGTLSGETKKRDDELAKALKEETGERQKADVGIKDQLRKAVAEGIPLGRVGAIFFLFGIAAGTASPEIASLFGGNACQ